MKNKIRVLIVKFLQKTKLNKLAHKIYYRYVHGFNTATEDLLPALEKVFAKAKELGSFENANYYEFGVFKGYAFWYAYKTAQKYNFTQMKFFGFDSFQGLPKVEGIDKTQEDVFYEGQYSCSKEAVTKNLDSQGIDWEKAFLIDGFFEDSLNEKTKEEYSLARTGIALIDCDLYSSTVSVLNFLRDMLMDSTLIIFDDWNCFDGDDEKGQRKAFKEFLAENSNLYAESLFSYGAYGQVFLVQKKA